MVCTHVRTFYKQAVREFIMSAKIVLACSECKSRNYSTTKGSGSRADRLTFSKYCSTCGKHTTHVETK
ncbi:50S ribosomal protein L33 [Alteribacter lacisalsi]